ncbi:hypothetical protein ATANTOWER_021684 [Ataeniobius toweri]|uniref:Uncharacterized protein n=1 Tax=Ataeniobius toweri TaxID=208326 RepID=A0ABU7BTV1_9TELE|nr:hypothetical protein [Ataeniobius toweri]
MTETERVYNCNRIYLPSAPKPVHTITGKVQTYDKEKKKTHLPKENMYIQVDDTCSSVKCGSHLQRINITDRLVCLCLECAIGTHSSPAQTEAWSHGCLLLLYLDKQRTQRIGGLKSAEGLAGRSAPYM